MKIRTVVITVAGLAVAGYVGATYVFSSHAAASAAIWARKIGESMPTIKVGTDDYQRGLFKSTQNITLELPGVGANAGSVTLRSVIQHGPFPGFAGVGVARIEHTLVFDEATAKALAGAFGDQPPFAATTLVTLDGDGVTELKGAPASYRSADGSVSWQGITGNLRFTKGMASYSGELAAPGLTATDKSGSGVSMNAFSMKMEQARLANTETLYLGPFSMGIESITVNNAGKTEFEAKKIAVNTEVTSKDGQFLDIVARLLAAEFRAGANSGTNAEYAISFHHLHAQSFDQFAKAMRAANQQMASAPGAAKVDPMAAIGAMQATLKTHGLAMLKQQPVIAIDRIGFQTGEGELKVAGSAKLLNVTDADFDNPMSLIGKVDAAAKIFVSDALARKLFIGSMLQSLKKQGREPDQTQIDEATATANLAFGQQLAQYQQQGYVAVDQGILSSSVAFRGGELTVNDKPFNPLAPAGPPPMQIPPGRQ